MGNIIRLDDAAPVDRWLSMSNQGTDCFLELLIYASGTIGQTQSQKEMVSFLKDRKDINDVAPGTAGFDIKDMPWEASSLSEDVRFLLRVIEMAKSRTVWEKLPYEPEGLVVIPFLDLFADMVREMDKHDG